MLPKCCCFLKKFGLKVASQKTNGRSICCETARATNEEIKIGRRKIRLIQNANTELDIFMEAVILTASRPSFCSFGSFQAKMR